MPSADQLEYAHYVGSIKVPVVPGVSDSAQSRIPLSPIEDPPKAEVSPRRMWTAAGAVALVASLTFVNAFAGRARDETEFPTCTVVVASEPAKNSVDIQLDHPPGNEKVWIGNDEGVMEAGRGSDATQYHLADTGQYLHNTIIGVYVGATFCFNRFDLHSPWPGDEEFFAQ
ncbi:MAG TPA: hypothetical protein VLE73_05900 [Candidatus Saccharimonadales bacterium]|nr:hypothetical protein [Candidatus Saccharimonadales bacterium]